MNGDLKQLLIELAGFERAERMFELLTVDQRVATGGPLQSDSRFSQTQLAQALNMLLFEDLLQRVPEAETYVNEKHSRHQKVQFDHGALRTVRLPMQSLPPGKEAFSRIFEALGYVQSGTYPLDRLKMCGFVYTHREFPETIAQYFVSELYPEQFSERFQQAASDLLWSSRDPLDADCKAILTRLKQDGYLKRGESLKLLAILPLCFARQHDIPSVDQYRLFMDESAEMAWIATEGNAFNHATDRVEDLDTLVEQERGKGRPMKPKIEVGKHANIRQTAYRASVVEREFRQQEGIVTRQVPGSFFEFIERGPLQDSPSRPGQLDLRFDSQNAQGIFTMTR